MNGVMKTTINTLLGVSLALVGTSAMAFDVGPFKVSGYLRQYVSANLEDQPETTRDDEFKLQMNRSTLFLDVTTDTGPLAWTGRFRFSKDWGSGYEDDLEDLTDLGGGFNRADFDEEYDEADIRELYVTWPVNDSLDLSFGKQQVVWGETDFFHATDVIHGYDLRWRTFLVPENEDVRKAQILAVANILVPQAKGDLQIVVRPGLDHHDKIGNSIPAFGGRWSGNMNKGFNLIGSAPFNYHHELGDTDDAHYGLRWNGTLGQNDDLNYSLNYYHGQSGFQQDPILVCDVQADFYNGACTGPFNGLAFIFPETDTLGASASGYFAGIDSVWRAEVAYTPDRPMGTAFGQVVEIDAWNFVIGLDTNLRLQNVLGTSSPSLFTVQLFDWHLPGVKTAPALAAFGDVVMNFVGSGKYKEHNVLVSGIFTLPYANDIWKVTLVGLADLSFGGAAFIPAVEYAPGPHWRVKLEWDHFFGGDVQTPSVFPPNASIFGFFDNMDQLLLRATYQF